MSRMHRWHQKKRKARRAQHLHNWLTLAHTSQQSDTCSYSGLPLSSSSAMRIK